ncbi:MAG: CHAT domain-containing protein, partial [Cyanobacteria bacterium J06641_5]
RKDLGKNYPALLAAMIRERVARVLSVLGGGLRRLPRPGRANSKVRSPATVLESLQLAELDNFFQDPCVVQTEITAQIDNIDPDAAVLYPVVLPDRIEIVLSMPGQPLQAATIPVGQAEVNETLDALYDLFGNESIDNSAVNIFRTVPVNPQEVSTNLQQLLPLLSQVYDWLIRPLEPALAENETETLVFVLSDRLQRVPLAALFDGQQYLLSKYGLALVPGLQLVDADPLEERSVEVLAAGVSEQVQLEEFIFPALSNVPRELAQIQVTFPKSKTLLDGEFTAIAVEESLRATAYPIVHFATHGQFSSNPENNFIVTGAGDRLDIARLQTLLSSDSLIAPELLVLSACQTATGDDRAVLGLAGTAVRSGARSTLATLWPVSDAATAQFMGEFYGQLGQGATKVEALRQSQLSLIQVLQTGAAPAFTAATPEFTTEVPAQSSLPHPFYWSPYVLVGNWL